MVCYNSIIPFSCGVGQISEFLDGVRHLAYMLASLVLYYTCQQNLKLVVHNLVFYCIVSGFHHLQLFPIQKHLCLIGTNTCVLLLSLCLHLQQLESTTLGVVKAKFEQNKRVLCHTLAYSMLAACSCNANSTSSVFDI